MNAPCLFLAVGVLLFAGCTHDVSSDSDYRLSREYRETMRSELLPEFKEGMVFYFSYPDCQISGRVKIEGARDAIKLTFLELNLPNTKLRTSPASEDLCDRLKSIMITAELPESAGISYTLQAKVKVHEDNPIDDHLNLVTLAAFRIKDDALHFGIKKHGGYIIYPTRNQTIPKQ